MSYLEWTEMATFQQRVTLLHTPPCKDRETMVHMSGKSEHTIWRDPRKLARARDMLYLFRVSMTSHRQASTQCVLRIEFFDDRPPHPTSRRQVIGVSKDIKTLASSGQGHCRNVSERVHSQRDGIATVGTIFGLESGTSRSAHILIECILERYLEESNVDPGVL